MKIKVVGLLSMCSLVLGMNFSAFAACYSSEAGEYCLTYKKYTCPAGCYCQKAPGDYGALDRKGNGQREIYEEDVAAWCKNGTACKWSGGTGQCGTSDDAKVFRCPADFPTSDAGASKAEDCYNSCGGTKLPYKKIHCDKGYFLHYKTKECYKCEGRNSDPSLSAKAICIGGDFYPTCNMTNQGTKLCEDPMVPNKERTECVQIEQPKEEVKEEMSTDPISVQPGYYLPKGSKATKQCSEATYYCPGGSYAESSGDQGKFKCPKNTTANQKRTACVAKVPKSNLKTGPNPNTPTEFQCWMSVTDIEKYKLCIIANPYYK